jgi:hypothetical protein
VQRSLVANPTYKDGQTQADGSCKNTTIPWHGRVLARSLRSAGEAASLSPSALARERLSATAGQFPTPTLGIEPTRRPPKALATTISLCRVRRDSLVQALAASFQAPVLPALIPSNRPLSASILLPPVPVASPRCAASNSSHPHHETPHNSSPAPLCSLSHAHYHLPGYQEPPGQLRTRLW